MDNGIRAFSLVQLSQRLGIDVPSLRVEIALQSLACNMREDARRLGFDPIVSRDAAIAFCVNTGRNPSRITR